MENPHVIVLFGATGDLARRKLLPGHAAPLGGRPARRLPDRRHLARGHRHRDVRQDRPHARATSSATGPITDERWEPFAEMLRYVPQSAGPEALAAAVARAEAEVTAATTATSTSCTT